MGWTLFKAVSLAYVLGALSLSLASLLWWQLRRALAPQARSTAAFYTLLLSALLSLIISLCIAAAVITHGIQMTTPYFHGLMGGTGAALITYSGWAVLLLSIWLSLRSILRSRLPRSLQTGWREAGLDIVTNSGVATACLVGIWKPELWVNPTYWDRLNANERSLVLHHENVHVRRHDNLRKLVLQYIAGLYFVLPWIRRWPADYELDSELAVDDICRTELPEVQYSAVVACAVEIMSQRQLQQVSSALSQADIVARLSALLSPRRSSNPALPAAVALLTAAFSSAPGMMLLSYPVSRCFLACYLGY